MSDSYVYKPDPDRSADPSPYPDIERGQSYHWEKGVYPSMEDAADPVSEKHPDIREWDKELEAGG